MTESDETARLARAAGLDKFQAAYPDQLKSALQSASALARRLPKDLAPAEEPAHALRLASRTEAGQ
ncbi:MAG: hypothetical protein AB7F78_01965 [Hyphomicrobiaceae bacterium]